jgi:hypothetical protein
MPQTLYAGQTNGNFLAAPRWLAEFTGRDSIIPTPALIDPTAFNDYAGVTAVVGAAGAAANATSIPVAALTQGPTVVAPTAVIGNVVIPAGANLYFGGAKKLARVTVDAKIGDTAITVEALPTALVSGDTARYNSVNPNGKYLPGGLLVGRTFAERDAGTPYGVADVVTPDDQIFLTVFDISDANKDAGIELLRHNMTVKENYLPDWASYTSGMKTVLRARYRCITGTD